MFRQAGDSSQQEIQFTCTLTPTTGDNNETRYSYTGESCKAESASGVISKEFSDYELVGYGDVSSNIENQNLSATVTSTDFDGALSGEQTGKGLTNQTRKIDGNKSATDTTYTYYLIVAFPDTGDNQNGTANANFNKEISVSLDSITNIQSTLVTE